MEYIYRYRSPFGGIVLSSDGEALTGLRFDGPETKAPLKSARLPVFDETVKWLDIYFGGKEPGFTPVLKIKGTPFRERVWKILAAIPYGQTATYGEIAARIAAQTGVSKMSAQAVGGAVGHNPIALIIPCHRVIGANGELVGYGGGIDKKIKLLALEGADTEKLRIRIEDAAY